MGRRLVEGHTNAAEAAAGAAAWNRAVRQAPSGTLGSALVGYQVACIVMAYIVMVYILMACIVMACIGMAYTVIACTVIAYIVMDPQSALVC